jgi:hypothetical protein
MDDRVLNNPRTGTGPSPPHSRRAPWKKKSRLREQIAEAADVTKEAVKKARVTVWMTKNWCRQTGRVM